MGEAGSFLRDLDDVISRGTPESRERALWHATDLLLAGRYRDEEVEAFGAVIGRLADEIEVAARAELAERLVRTENAPANIMRKLAFDDAIEVAGPVLRESEHLDNDTLVASALTKGQPHLLAISQRKFIDEAVTDVLVRRGNREVVNSVASNRGARLSNFGFLHMIKRAEGDSILAEQLGLRSDIPRHVFQQLIAKASDDVKRRLARERPEMAGTIQTSVSDVAGALQSKFGPSSRGHFVAKRVVTTQFRQGNLNEESIAGYAVAHRVDEVTIGMSLLASVPADAIERALMDQKRDLLLILARALGFSWKTTMALLFLGAKEHRITVAELRDLEGAFAGINVETSRKVLEFYQSRKNTGPSAGNPGGSFELQMH